mmetsp:Transcript_26269/g.81896  ORF Transcript_26269/g.81896 Transcript_26269/m.81896 type:complete len:175 (+) Transcript_26269:798-1322(+)
MRSASRSMANSQHSSIVALNRYGLSMQDREVQRASQQLAAEAYGQFQCFSGSHTASTRPASQRPDSSSGALSTVPLDLRSAFQELLEEQKRTIMLQIKADLRVRGRGAPDEGSTAARSLAGSDAGESTYNMIQELGMAEHFSIASEAGSVHGGDSSAAGNSKAAQSSGSSVEVR